MITSYLQGGLGNQMFQIAAAWSLSKDLGVGCFFNLNETLIITQGNKANKYKDNFFKNITNCDCDKFGFSQYYETTFSYRPIPLVDNQILKGGFQSEKFFFKYKNELKSLFWFDEEKIREIKNKILNFSDGQSVCSIHVRRGDYLQKPNFHPVLQMEYYKKSMNILGSKKYVVVSDDLEWCKQNFIGDEFLFTDGNNEIDDFYTIMCCDNHIIANSSFSWWASYLCENKNKKIICPSTWFGIHGPQDTQDIYLDSWIKI
jgi:hypothetical protein